MLNFIQDLWNLVADYMKGKIIQYKLLLLFVLEGGGVNKKNHGKQKYNYFFLDKKNQ